MAWRPEWTVAWLTAAVMAALVVLARPLTPHGFVSGDQGVRLIAARNALAHPTRPFEIDLPRIDDQPVSFVDPMFRVHGGHAHAIQSPLFPVLTAPILDAVGVRGLYLLPMLSFASLVPLLYAIARRTLPDVSMTALAATAVLANPLFFYALEFWEHVPAAAVLAASTALALRSRSSPWMPALAGVLAATGVLLRPEAIWYALVLLGVARAGTARLTYAATVGGGLATFAVVNVLENGTLMGPHADAALATLLDGWPRARWQRLVVWLLPRQSPLFVAAAAVLSIAWLLRSLGRPEAARDVGIVAAVGLSTAAVLGHIPRDTLWAAWPIGGLALLPGVQPRSARPLVWLGLGTSVLVWLTSTHDGGAQWGPRILLVSAPALVLLAARGWDAAIAPGSRRAMRIAAVVAITASGLWTSRAAYVDLRGWKRYYGTLVSRVGQHTAPGSYVVTNVWWLDQISAPLYGTRTFLMSDSPADTLAILRRLETAAVPTVHLAWSAEPAHPGPIDTTGTCYRAHPPVVLEERQVHIAAATCQAQ